MVKQELLKIIGSMQQVAYVRKIQFDEGRAGGMKAIEVKSGEIIFTAMGDKCLDICQLSYKGIGLNFLSKPGLQGRNQYDTNSAEAQRSMMCGLFFTCGTDNVGGPVIDGNQQLVMHGRLRTTPAEHVCCDAYWEMDHYKLEIKGEMRQAMLFGENIVLRRTISTIYGSNIIHIHDEVTNEAFAEVPLMFLYHYNIGYPLLDENSSIILPTQKTTLKGEGMSASNLNWDKFSKPVDNVPEQVFYHDLIADREGNTTATIVNDTLGIGVQLRFNKKQFPYFTQWKSMASGDYVVGLEPGNCHVEGRVEERKQGTLKTLASFETAVFDIDIIILDRGKQIWITH